MTELHFGASSRDGLQEEGRASESAGPFTPGGGASFTRAGLLVTASLGVSALILVGAFLAYRHGAVVWSGSPPMTWTGGDLRLVQGTGQRLGSGWRIQGLSPQGQAVLATVELAIRADRFAYLDYAVDGLMPSGQAWFFWRNAADPARAYAVALVRPGLGRGVIPVDASPGWKGTVTQVGILLRGSLSEPLTVERMTLRPASVGTLLSAVWSDWTALEGWSRHSANWIVGGPAGQVVQPVPAAAAWAVLALACYGLGRALGRKPWSWSAAAAILLVPWLALDARWQLDLWRQLEQTQERYAGKSLEAKRLAADDGELYAFLRQVKGRLPPQPQRIFLLTSRARSAAERTQNLYVRLRSLYHLLPQNVYAYWREPPPLERARSGDYVLTLGNAARVAFEPAQGLLRWQGPSLPVRLEYSSPSGALYRVR